MDLAGNSKPAGTVDGIDVGATYLLVILLSSEFPSGSPVEKTQIANMDLRLEFLKKAPSAEAMEQLFEGLKDVMFSLKDPQGRYLSANKAFLLRVGIADRKGLIGKTSREVFPTAQAMGFEQQDREILQGRNFIYNLLEVVTNPDRSLGWYITDKVPVRDSRHQILAVASTTKDLKIRAEDDSEMGRIVKFVNAMSEQFSEPIRISKLAEQSGMSLAKLERRMRAIMSTSPRQLLTRIRVEAASELLRSTQQPLSEIAYGCGFCDQPTFCRQFKNWTGMTAGDYRRQGAGGK